MAGYIGSKTSVVSSGVERKKTYSITGSTTSLTGLNYTVGKVHVFQNGVRLLDGTDYTATNGTSITLTVAAQSGDNVVVVSQASFQLSEHYTSAEADAEFVTKTGDTMSGNLNVTGTVTSDGLTVDGNATISSAAGSLYLEDNNYTAGQKVFGVTSKSGDLLLRSFTDDKLTATNRFGINHSTGDISFYEDTGTTAKFFWDSSAESLGIGTSSPNAKIDASGTYRMQLRTDDAIPELRSITTNGATFKELGLNGLDLRFYTSSTERMRIDSSGNVGIGTDNPTGQLHIKGDADMGIRVESAAGGYSAIAFGDSVDTVRGGITYYSTDNSLQFRGYNNTERMRIDSSGNLLVGKTSQSVDTVGGEILPSGIGQFTVAGNFAARFTRQTSHGDIVVFRKGTGTVGSIGNSTQIYMDGAASAAGFKLRVSDIIPRRNGADADNLIDLGDSSFRFDDIYATNGTIQTSDFNEKQDIASLTATEMLVGKRISALFKTFRWKDSVAEKGDNARTHTGVIAQDVQAAFTAEGLDAGDYALFISSTWFVDAEGNEVEEGTEGATSKTRMGIRYPELLSFVAAYNEQRFASIEARLTALEA